MTPGKPANPDFLIIDTSVLLQIIATDSVTVLRWLRSEYNIQPAIVPAVESEASQILSSFPKFIGRQVQLAKALGNRTISLVDRELLSSKVTTGVDALLRQIDAEGQRFRLFVDRGEAFSHAASLVLGAPIATNDTTAVRRLEREGEKILQPVIRFWDLIVLARQMGHLDDHECDRIRKTLSQIGERQPACFTGAGFTPGLGNFYGRLVDGSAQAIGAKTPQITGDTELVLFK